jgi:hypothetical protein
MALLMVTLVKMFKPYGDVGGSNLEVESNEKPRDNEDPKKESKKDPKKEKPSSSAINPS